MVGELRKFLCPEFIFGNDSRLLLGQYLINFGIEKTLIVTDKNLRKYAWFNDIIKRIKEQNIQFDIFDEVTVNPRDFEVELGAIFYEACDADIIVAIGGGSVIDCAKGIGILVSNGGTIYDYEGVDQVDYPIPPLICIPTTSGSAADVSQFAIISNQVCEYKMALASKTLVPDMALVDPVVTLTCDFNLTVDVGLDTMVHAIEAYVSNASSFITDIHAIEAIKMIIIHLPKLANDLENLEERGYVMQACLNAGLAFSNASLGLVHAMAHALGGRLDLVHGELNGILLEAVVDFNYDASKERYDEISTLIQQNSNIKSGKITDVLHEFIANIRHNRSIPEMSSEAVDLYDVAKYVLNDPCIVTNPKTASIEDVVKIYEQIF
ncbi:MAG: iron-containing alcohol dehydrogenase [Clostridiales bacterium]|nr:iron-containing alcohol dehydrogenase [Clostridiales bacterium]